MEKTKTIPAQDKWATADETTRSFMLDLISYSRSFAKTSWRKLPYLIRTNLEKKSWTN
jgi:hypothetical protein